MAHSLIPSTATPVPTSPGARKKKKTPFPVLGFQRGWRGHWRSSVQAVSDDESLTPSIDRRAFIWGLTAAALGLNLGCQSASAAKKRPPPPPPEEKKDPNVSGVQAKVIASIKRKEAMKAAMAKQREKGKVINEPSE